LNSLEHCYLQIIRYPKRTVNDLVVGLTKLSKTQRNIGLLCAVLKVMSYSL